MLLEITRLLHSGEIIFLIMTIILFLFFAELAVPTVSSGEDESSGVDPPIIEHAPSSSDKNTCTAEHSRRPRVK